MPNPLYSALNGANNMNPMNNFVNALNRLKASFKGDPQQQVQNMLNSGKISQEQYNRAVQMAKQIQGMFK